MRKGAELADQPQPRQAGDQLARDPRAFADRDQDVDVAQSLRQAVGVLDVVRPDRYLMAASCPKQGSVRTVSK